MCLLCVDVFNPLQLDGPLYAIVQSLFVHTLQQWEEHRLTFLKRLIVLVHARRASASSIKKYAEHIVVPRAYTRVDTPLVVPYSSY